MSTPTAASPKFKYTAQRGFFSHDSDPASWEFRATTRPSLGLLDRSYPTDAAYDPKREKTQWERFIHYLHYLNKTTTDKKYKLFYLIRHGQGIHNVKEAEVGREEWDRYWSKLSGDATTIWEDAALTLVGEQQAKDIARFFEDGDVAAPERVYSSPLQRCLRTTELAYSSFPIQPIVKENLRERLGVHTCDKRGTKSYIADAFPKFAFEAGFTEEDELWKPDVRESLDEHVIRKTKLLDEIFSEAADALIISLTVHSGAIMALFGATGWGMVPVAAGAVYPLLVLAESEG
ncbi:phosphoglycerate mutase-like protein [Byssothecium circinans]|uniref:Phosphoglycerate mutase-like protein n=1 Tax=Byssothecium circinans TaxID=147558 RepID=A0A6A5TGX9_9PLEO|nr:phosphoglycerate mutase-like protein [Byssothecium circinans]